MQALLSRSPADFVLSSLKDLLGPFRSPTRDTDRPLGLWRPVVRTRSVSGAWRCAPTESHPTEDSRRFHSAGTFRFRAPLAPFAPPSARFLHHDLPGLPLCDPIGAGLLSAALAAPHSTLSRRRRRPAPLHFRRLADPVRDLPTPRRTDLVPQAADSPARIARPARFETVSPARSRRRRRRPRELDRVPRQEATLCRRGGER